MHFPTIVGISNPKLIKIASDLDSYYNEWVEKKVDKKTGNYKTYKDGTVKQRVIRPSKSILKLIQKRIKDRALLKIELPDNIHGGVKGKSNISNAKPHQGKKYIFTTDLQNFYPSIKSNHIYNTFLNLGFNTQFCFYITKFTTWKGELPQGTPTSTHISNIVFLQTDYQLINLCREHNITYTRYIDDLTFSSQTDFQELIPKFLDIVIQSDFKISRRKTRYCGNQNITGIDVFLDKIDAPPKIYEKVLLEVTSGAANKPYSNYVKNIKGYKKK